MLLQTTPWNISEGSATAIHRRQIKQEFDIVSIIKWCSPMTKFSFVLSAGGTSE